MGPADVPPNRPAPPAARERLAAALGAMLLALSATLTQVRTRVWPQVSRAASQAGRRAAAGAADTARRVRAGAADTARRVRAGAGPAATRLRGGANVAVTRLGAGARAAAASLHASARATTARLRAGTGPALTRLRTDARTAATRLRAGTGPALTRLRAAGAEVARQVPGRLAGSARGLAGAVVPRLRAVDTAVLTATGWFVDRLATESAEVGRRLRRAVGTLVEHLAYRSTVVGRDVAHAVGWTTHHLADGAPALALALLDGAARAQAGMVPRLGRACRGAAVAVGWIADRSAGLVVATGRGMLAAVILLERGVLAILSVAVHRVAPAIAGFVSLALAVVAWTMMLTSAGAPTINTYADAVEVGLKVPQETVLPRLAERSVIYAADGGVLAVLHDEVDRRVISFDRLPEHVWQAVVAAEDRRFFEHEGYDVEAITRAAVANLQAGGITQGGSTITQQIAKQNFVGAEQTFERKTAELAHAVALEQHFSKEELLERYLNQVYFGSGAYGIAAAAEEFFGVAPEELTVDQAAMLAGVIRAPSANNPRSSPEQAQARRDGILDAMAEEGYLTRDEADAAASEPLEVLDHRERDVREPYAVEAVKREFFSNPAFGETRQDRIDRLFSGGLAIHTTIDPDLQDIAAEAIEARFDDPEGPTAAIAAVEPATGRVLAAHSGADFDAEQFDLATQGRRQPGSSFKTFVLAAALAEHYPLDGLVDASSPIELDYGGTDDWEVQNYEGNDYGIIDLREALVRSSNTAFAQLMLTVGQDEVTDLVGRVGIDVQGALGDESTHGPSMALGGLTHGVTPLEMASAYAVFANAGDQVAPFLIDEVVDADGIEVYSHEPEAQRVLDPAVTAQLTEAMQEAVEDGTGRAARLDDWQPAGKTGTTQRHVDAWFVGYVPVLSTAVWVGHPEGQVRMPGMTGGSAPAELWHDFMERALEDVDPEPFAFPADSAAVSERVDVPDLRGLERKEALQELLEAKLVGSLSEEATDADDDDVGVVVRQRPRPGDSVRAGDTVDLAFSSDRVEGRDAETLVSEDDEDDHDEDDDDEEAAR